MKHRLRDLLSCPVCGSYPFDLTVLETEPVRAPAVQETRCSHFCSWDSQEIGSAGAAHRPCSDCYGLEICQAILHCRQCQREFPVIDGIPRFNPDAESDYPGFFCRYGQAFRERRTPDLEALRTLDVETKRSFGYQWLRYRVTEHADNRVSFFECTGTAPGSIANTLLFEAGCGMGRYLKVITDEPAAEAVGLDLSLAVNRAYEENRGSPFIHIIQGDILQLPLRPESFDHVYSIGVLHHTPSTERAFRCIAKLAKPGARVSIWVYPVWRPPALGGLKAVHAGARGWVSDTLRRVTTRFPHPLLHRLCYFAAPLGWLQRQIARLPLPWEALLFPLTLIPCSMHPSWRIRLLDTFDWYSPRYQWKHTVPEVVAWFQQAGFEDIDTEGGAVSVRGVRSGVAR